jgi:predicted RNase H-like nuclease (RuvC/YqgF family)
LANDEDKAYGIDKWAALFKASTWEELKAMATQNTVFDEVAEAMFKFSSNRDVLDQCRKIEDRKRDIQRLNDKAEKLEKENKSLRASNAEQAARIAYLESQLKQNK